MDASKIELGTLLLVASGLTLEATGLPGASIPFGLAGLAAVGLAASVVVGPDDGPTG